MIIVSLQSFVFYSELLKSKFLALKSFLVVVVVVACLIIVSTPGPDFVRVKARFGKFGDEVGQRFIWSSW